MNDMAIRELVKIRRLLEAIADRVGVEKPEKKSVKIDNDLVVSITRDHVTHETVGDDSLIPSQLHPHERAAMAGTLGAQKPIAKSEPVTENDQPVKLAEEYLRFHR